MKEELIAILKKLGYPVMLQGSLAADEEYKPAFFTFWNRDTSDGSHYDDEPLTYVWTFDVNFYASNPTLVNTVPLLAIKALKDAGWIIDGRGYDLISDEPTHTGRGFNAQYCERNPLV